MKVTTDAAQGRALNQLRGLPPDAHMLIMCSKTKPSGALVLDGSEDDFAQLIDHISEEIADGMLSPRASQALGSLCIKIDPACREWLGM